MSLLSPNRLTSRVHVHKQELRHALIPGLARDLLKSWSTSPEFIKATSGSVRDERMADREMVLRFIAFRLAPPDDYSSQDFDEFLRRAMRRLNVLEDEQRTLLRQEFGKSMRAARSIFDDHAFRKQYSHAGKRLPINKAIFDAVAVNLAMLTDGEIEILRRRKILVNKKFAELMMNQEFERSVSQGTGDTAKVKLRFRLISEVFCEVIDD